MEITISDLLKLDNPNIIDIRDGLSYNSNHIPGAINISYNNLVIKPSNYLNKSEKYYIYCKYGRTSLGLCRILRNLGYEVYSISGGFENYNLNN